MDGIDGLSDRLYCLKRRAIFGSTQSMISCKRRRKGVENWIFTDHDQDVPT